MQKSMCTRENSCDFGQKEREIKRRAANAITHIIPTDYATSRRRKEGRGFVVLPRYTGGLGLSDAPVLSEQA